MSRLLLLLPLLLALLGSVSSFQSDSIKPEIMLLLASSVFVLFTLLASPLHTRNRFIFNSKAGLSLICLVLIALFSCLFLAEGKLVFFLLLLILYMFQFLYGIFLDGANCIFSNLGLCTFSISITALYIGSKSFNAVSEDGLDTLGLSSGKIIARASIGSFESNSLAILCCALLSICILLLGYFPQNTFVNSLNVKTSIFRNFCFNSRFYLFSSIGILFLSILRTFSRTGFMAILLSVMLSMFLNLKSAKKLKYSKSLKSLLIFFLLLFPLIFAFSYLFPEFQEIALSRFSLRSLSYDVRLDIWEAKIKYLIPILFVGSGIFEFADNFWLSIIGSFGILVGGLLIFFTLSPFFFLLKLTIIGKLPISIRFSSLLICLSALLYSISGDFMGQSKTLPILYLACGLFLGRVKTLSSINI